MAFALDAKRCYPIATPNRLHDPMSAGVFGDLGYDGPVCIEVEDRAYERSLQTRKDALCQSARFLRQFSG